MSTPLSFKKYLSYIDDENSSKTKKKLNKKSHKGRYYGGAVNGLLGNMETGDGVSEAAIPTVWNKKLLNVVPEDEEDDVEATEDDLDLDGETPEDDNEDDISNDDSDDEMSEEDPEEDEDPNRQGVIRVVQHAHLVYKRKDEEGSYDELWLYKMGDGVNDELEVRRSILAGTDIDKGKTQSDDGIQKLELWSSGNIQMLLITGLPN